LAGSKKRSLLSRRMRNGDQRDPPYNDLTHLAKGRGFARVGFILA